MIYVLNNWKIIKVKFTYRSQTIKNEKKIVKFTIPYISIIHDRVSTNGEMSCSRQQD